MIVNKNDLTKLARVLVTYLGYMSIAFGLALPAYGQSVPCVSTDTASVTASVKFDDDEGRNGPPIFAGCGASAETAGSIAVGNNASVEAYTKTIVVRAIPGKATDTFYRSAELDGMGNRLATATGTLVEQDPDDGDLLHVIGQNGRTGATIRRTAGETSALG